MKRILASFAALFALSAALLTPALAADDSNTYYPTSITMSEDRTELRKVYDLSPEADPAGIPRSDFELNGFAYSFVDILRQELPEYEERQHTETVTADSDKKDMESVLALLPQERETVTEDGLSGVLSLKLDSVRVEPAGYGSTAKNVTATRIYPNLDGQDTSYIPKTVEDGGRTLTLQTVKWETVGSEGDERYTATATYTGTAKNSYVKGYTVTADYTGTVSRISLSKVRYVAIFSGVSLEPEKEPDEGQDSSIPPDSNENNGAGTAVETPSRPDEPTEDHEGPAESVSFPWGVVFAALAVAGVLGIGVTAALVMRCRSEKYYENDGQEDGQ